MNETYLYIWRDSGALVVESDCAAARARWSGDMQDVAGDPDHVWPVMYAKKQEMKFGGLEFASLGIEDILGDWLEEAMDDLW